MLHVDMLSFALFLFFSFALFHFAFALILESPKTVHRISIKNVKDLQSLQPGSNFCPLMNVIRQGLVLNRFTDSAYPPRNLLGQRFLVNTCNGLPNLLFTAARKGQSVSVAVIQHCEMFRVPEPSAWYVCRAREASASSIPTPPHLLNLVSCKLFPSLRQEAAYLKTEYEGRHAMFADC
jgi:hypothetical protein